MEFFKKGENIAIGVFILLFLFFFSGGVVRGDSMAPTLLNRETFLMIRTTDVKIGDVIVFRYDKKTDYIKRVVAKEGDVVVSNEYGIFINDKPFLTERQIAGFTVTVPQGEIFVIGDNTVQSVDSRDFGTIRKEKIRGRVVLKFDKLSKMLVRVR